MRKVLRKVVTTEINAVVRCGNTESSWDTTVLGIPTLSYATKRLSKVLAMRGMELVSVKLGKSQEAVYEMSLEDFLTACAEEGTVTVTKTF